MERLVEQGRLQGTSLAYAAGRGRHRTIRTRLRRAAALLMLLFGLALSAPAPAQSPSNQEIDENGVDLVEGEFQMSQELLSIGPDLPRGLRYARFRAGNRWADNFTASVDVEGAELRISVGETSGRFTINSDGTYTTALGDGATLVTSGVNLLFTNARGVVARLAGNLIVDITYPEGSKLTFHYAYDNYCDEFGQNCVGEFRLQAVVNNYDYQIRFAYAQDTLDSESDLEAWRRRVSARAINTAVEACNPTAISCSLSGSWPTVTFARSGQQETVTLPDSGAWLFTESTPSGLFPGGYITAVRRPGASSDDVGVTYNGGTGTSLTNANGTWNYAFSSSAPNTIMTVTGPLGLTREVTSNASGLVIADEDSLGRTTSYQYDSLERLTRVTWPEGNYVQLSYDSRGNVTEQRFVAKAGWGQSDLVTGASYPSSCGNPVTCNLPTSVTDARGNTTDYTWDSTHGGMLTETGPAPTGGATRPQTRYGYGSATVGGRTVYRLTSIAACQTSSSCAAGADEALATIAYSGSNDRPVSVSRANGSGTLTAATALAYDDVGNLITIDGPLSGTADTARMRYDAVRRRVGLISADPDGGGSLKHRALRTTYDSAGQVTAEETGTVDSQSDGDWASMSVLEGVTTTRDSFGRPSVLRRLSGGTTYALTQVSYDASGRLDCIAQRMNTAEFAPSSLPSSACALDSEGSHGPDRITRHLYDAVGRLARIRTALNTSLERDIFIRGFSHNGFATYVIDGENNLTDYVHDGHDRLAYIFYPVTTQGADAASSNDYDQFAYDANGNLLYRVLRDGTTISYSHDALNRLTAIDPPGSEPTIGFTYDLLNRMTGASQTGNALTFSYDALGNNLSQAGPLGTVDYTYDLAGRRTRTTYADSGLYVDYDYLLTGEVTKIRENGATSGVGVLGTYAYDGRGRRTSLTRGNGAVTGYSYDNVSRLTQIVQNPASTGYDLTLDLTPNPAGQIAGITRSNDSYAWTGHYSVNRNYTADGLNRYTAVGGVTPGYDARGNMTSADGVTYGYDSANLLVSATGGVTLAYDPLGRLYQIVGGSTTRMAYDGEELIAEYNGSNVLQRRYVFGPWGDEPLVRYDGTGTSDRHWFHADERGSVIAISDGSGAVTAVNSYDEYGIPGGGNSGRFQYTGQQWLGELGLYHYRARAYSPTWGRFLQTDPIGYDGGMNLYAYVTNDPVNLIDPSGLQEIPGATVFGERWPLFGVTGGGGQIVTASASFEQDRRIGENPRPQIVVVGPRRCGLICRATRERNRIFLRMHPQVARNVRAIVDYVVGDRLSAAEKDELARRVLDELSYSEGERLSGVRRPASGPLRLSRDQFGALRDVLGRVGYGDVGTRANGVFTSSIREGRIRVGQ